MDITLEKLNDLLAKTTPEIRAVVMGVDIDNAVLSLTNDYHLSVAEGVAVKNTILFTLLGIRAPGEVKESLKRSLSVSEEDLNKILKAIDTGVFEKARLTLFGEEHEQGQEMRTLNLKDDKEKEVAALREQILSQTDRNSAIAVSPLESMPDKAPAPKPFNAPGSRADLLEQLNVLETIPNSEKVEERLASIRDKVSHIKETEVADTMRQEEEERVAIEKEKAKRPAISFPTQYNVDPYREIPDA